MLKDLRTYFNHLLVSRYGFSNKEASSLIGNSPEVNLKHYDPVSLSVIIHVIVGVLVRISIPPIN